MRLEGDIAGIIRLGRREGQGSGRCSHIEIVAAERLHIAGRAEHDPRAWSRPHSIAHQSQ